ncbi:MAG: OsmC family protein [Deltaproteobacteria bacterium]|nr:OsmC family protein [Deltaproteobacteria bacterium]
MRVRTEYQEDMRFASGVGDARVVMSGRAEADGGSEAPTPKQLVLHGLAGCTGLDVATMLERQKVPFEGLVVEAEAEQTNAQPKVFRTIRVVYRIRARAEDRPKVERAIELSQAQFCGVSAMLRRGATLEHRLDFEPLD